MGLPLVVAMLVLASVPFGAFGATGKKNPTSKLFVSDVEGLAEIDTGEKIEELEKKSVHTEVDPVRWTADRVN